MKKMITTLICSVVFSCSAFASGIEIVDFQDEQAARRFYESLETTGFVVITNHNLDRERLFELKDRWKNYFAQPETVKLLDSYENNPQTRLGFYPYGNENAEGTTQVNRMEFFHYALHQGLLSGDRELEAITAWYFSEMELITKTFVSWLDDQIPAEHKYYPDQKFTDMLTDSLPYTITRILNYLPGERGTVNLEHTDISFLSAIIAFLEEDDSSEYTGLQVKDNLDNWHNVDSSSLDIIINAGDMLKWLTKGHIKSTLHRVVGGAKQRLSFPYFQGIDETITLPDGRTVKRAFFERINNIHAVSAASEAKV